jgi:hypothetical protein
MKKLTNPFILYLLLFILSLIYKSCCEECHKIIGNGNLIIMQYKNGRQDTIRNEFAIDWYLERSFSRSCSHWAFIPSAQATTCQQVYINKLKKETIELFCDREIIYQGQLINAGSNILDRTDLSVEIDDSFGVVLFNFSTGFILKTEFVIGLHKFTVRAKTSDGIQFESSASTYLHI